ncbi:MAG: DUF1835 domain-containing protein [Candidatus Eremiobacteraeota bacterium]|nr:DUF1835 domain-containing protein [Candidatus Eremiobacteraeota bacterium]
MATLHVTNGDSVLYSFRKAGIAGTYLAWHDMLHEGPVPAHASLEETSAVRTRYLAARGYGSPIKVIADFQRRDATLRRSREFDEIVLWFEHDLYDQLQLLQVLTALEELEPEPGRTSIVQSDEYLGTMTADEISPLLPRRRAITPATFKSARRAWDRFTSSSVSELHASSLEDAIGLPFLRAAMRRLCEEFPWRRDGLSRSQRQALQAIAQGPGTLGELFRRAQAREEAAFLGDSAFAKIVEDLRAPSLPLIEGAEGALVPTGLGRRVLAGDADWLEAMPIDRWIGGMHLSGRNVARWDDDAARFV